MRTLTGADEGARPKHATPPRPADGRAPIRAPANKAARPTTNKRGDRARDKG